MPADTDDAELRRLLNVILDEVTSEAASHGKAKRACEALSWIESGHGLPAPRPRA